MDISIYKFLHLVGVLFVMGSLGGVLALSANGVEKTSNVWRARLAAFHGVGLFLILLGGFGMLAKLGYASAGTPAWAYLKMVLWLVLGAALALGYRMPLKANLLWWIVLLVATVAAYIGLFHG
jgi:hypothetical protein